VNEFNIAIANAKTALLSLIVCCFGLVALFTNEIAHDKKVNEIFDQYNKDMDELKSIAPK